MPLLRAGSTIHLKDIFFCQASLGLELAVYNYVADYTFVSNDFLKLFHGSSGSSSYLAWPALPKIMTLQL